MPLLPLKALHIIFIVTWFAGLFYIVRLFIYQCEAQTRPPQERDILTKQFKLMSRRLWKGITWPSAILTAITGPWLLMQIPGYLDQPWMHLKLSLVVLLYAYHLYCHKIFSEQQKDNVNHAGHVQATFFRISTISDFHELSSFTRSAKFSSCCS